MPDCIFCKIATHAIPVKPLHEDDLSIAFADLNPQSPTHILVIPKQHFVDVTESARSTPSATFSTRPLRSPTARCRRASAS